MSKISFGLNLFVLLWHFQALADCKEHYYLLTVLEASPRSGCWHLTRAFAVSSRWQKAAGPENELTTSSLVQTNGALMTYLPTW